jgi:tyrosyl-tRNA synthetase
MTSDPATEHLRHLEAFRRGAVDLIEERELLALLEKASAAGRGLRVKFGMDPSSPDLHIGHAIPLMCLRELQELGHTVVLIVGDATAMVGDPSGRNTLRPVLTREAVEHNLQTYTDQAGRILDMDRNIEVRRNSEWFDEMGFEQVLQLCTRMTVSQMIERDTFRRRMDKKEPIGINEFLYPLMQGWDSVMVDSDVELGGNDQLFNLHVGRRFQEREGQRRQVLRTHPLINGLDGRKMSKSYGNAIGVTDGPREMTFGVMRLDDEAMHTWFVQLTRLPEIEIAALLAGHPREAKARLAREITTFFHGEEAAAEAAVAFDRQVRDKELPDEIPEHPWQGAWGDGVPLPGLLKELGLQASTSEARRSMKGGGVRLDGEVVTDPNHQVPPPSGPVLVQVGKKRFARLLPPS